METQLAGKSAMIGFISKTRFRTFNLMQNLRIKNQISVNKKQKKALNLHFPKNPPPKNNTKNHTKKRGTPIIFCIKYMVPPQKNSPISPMRFGTFSSRGRSTAVAVRTSGLALRRSMVGMVDGSRCWKSKKPVFGSSKIHGNVINNGFWFG